MARIRTIKPSFWGNQRVARVSRDARLTFLGLLNLADDEGRLLGSPRRIAGELYPHDEKVTQGDVIGWLKELAGVGLIESYSVDGLTYIALPGWQEHQRISHRMASVLPAPDTVRNGSGVALESLRPEGEGERGSGSGSGGGGGVRGGTAGKRPLPQPFVVDEEMHAWLAEKFPRVDWRRETEKFADHWRSKGERRVDWTATWRNWIRRSTELTR